MSSTDELVDDDFDREVDVTIQNCLKLEKPLSFFVFAGAGSGKTRSLVGAVGSVREKYRRHLLLGGQRIAVITYTNAACDEIKRRINFDPLVEVSTIHSFVWNLIEGFNHDIRERLAENLAADLVELNAQQLRSRGDNQTTRDRARKIASKQNRLESLPEIKRFTYNPNGENTGRDSLNHSEVISLTAYLLGSQELLGDILINRFPILLIDESQDTEGALMTALIDVQTRHRGRFSLGLFGDQMQRIYTAGKVDLVENLPEDWKKPVKVMNHRCPVRVIDLINRIAAAAGANVQKPRSDAKPGTVRFFLARSGATKVDVESRVASLMADQTGDVEWTDLVGSKRLILEHHMAAERLGFHGMFEPLYSADRLRTGVLDGQLPELRFFSEQIGAVVRARLNDDEFTVASVVRAKSPLLSRAALLAWGEDQTVALAKADDAVTDLSALWKDGGCPTFRETLIAVAKSGLFNIPSSLQDFSYEVVEARDAEPLETVTATTSETLEAWEKFLNVPFDQIWNYRTYIDGKAGFDTHQGVKGLEFPRVMVIMDDAISRGFLFSYEKLFGAKDKTRGDLDNERAGKETGIDRTRRLFYVTCSRAEKSLALVAYSENPDAVKAQILRDEWFSEEEIVDLEI